MKIDTFPSLLRICTFWTKNGTLTHCASLASQQNRTYLLLVEAIRNSQNILAECSVGKWADVDSKGKRAKTLGLNNFFFSFSSF